MATVRPFSFKQSHLRRILLVLIFLLLVVYIYLILDRLKVNKQASRFHKQTFDGPRSLNHRDGQRSQSKPATTLAIDPKPTLQKTDNNLTDEELSREKFEPGMELTLRMMKHAWNGYKKYAWGEDELRPISKSSKGFSGKHSILLTIVDSLDTLMIMNMNEEYIEARDLLLERLSFNLPLTVSMFEINIRVLGGLLSAFALSGDNRYVAHAYDLGQRLMTAFANGTIFPQNQIHLQGHADSTLNNKMENVSLAQIGTFSLEFGYLSDILNDPTYINKALDIVERLAAMKTSIPGLYPTVIYPNHEVQPGNNYGLGRNCDSFYEYLLKYWLYCGKRNGTNERIYKAAVDEIKRHLIKRQNGRWFMVSMKDGKMIEEQEHLACFAPGMLALGAQAMNDNETFRLAESLTETCYLMYHKQNIGLAPESISIKTFQPSQSSKAHWLMRPEVVESLFVMWRLTKNPRYRRWGYEIAQNIEKWARVETGGYSGIENILTDPPKLDDHQKSLFLGETLKYLYLLFGPNDVLPLDEWVFNTEAHPFPINWRGTPMISTPKPSTLNSV